MKPSEKSSLENKPHRRFYLGKWQLVLLLPDPRVFSSEGSGELRVPPALGVCVFGRYVWKEDKEGGEDKATEKLLSLGTVGLNKDCIL